MTKIIIFCSHGRQYQHKLFSKSSALALLWMVNKSKEWICLTQHIRWPCKICLHCYNFANESSTLLIKTCIFCCKSVSMCAYISIYISINKCAIYSGNLAVQKLKQMGNRKHSIPNTFVYFHYFFLESCYEKLTLDSI